MDGHHKPEVDDKSPVSVFRSPQYGWVIVLLAALAMIATLPGRTHGLGMITERLLSDSELQLDRTTFGYVNLWATLAGALFCIPAGWLLDRCGLRLTSTIVVALLGLVVILMTKASSLVVFAILITLTRGLGQSALSVVSISMTGKWFRARLPLATGAYSLLVSIGFTAAFMWGKGQAESAWRTQWFQLGGLLLFVFAPLFAVLVRSAPAGLHREHQPEKSDDSADFTFSESLSTSAFWIFGFATSFYGLVSSGVSLFNESLLVERGFEKTAFYNLSMMTTGIGLAANLLTGILATRIKISWLAACAMGLLSAALLGLPFVSTYPALVTYAIAMGWAGGMVTVIFFTIWAKLFGQSELGRIQGVAQMMTVIASALGPVLLAEVKTRIGSYLPAIVALGLCAAVLAISVILVPVPSRRPESIVQAKLEPATGT